MYGTRYFKTDSTLERKFISLGPNKLSVKYNHQYQTEFKNLQEMPLPIQRRLFGLSLPVISNNRKTAKNLVYSLKIQCKSIRNSAFTTELFFGPLIYRYNRILFMIMNHAHTALLPQIQSLKLSHGQALLVIRGTRLAEHMTETAFQSMVKKFRRADVPFEPNEDKSSQWEEITYCYEHVAELAVAFKMQADGIAFRYITGLLINHRPKLHKLYHEAYLEAATGRGAPRTLLNANADAQNKEAPKLTVGGLYLDFRATYSNGIISSPGPVLLDPVQATERFMSIYDGLYPYPPLALSQICQSVVKIAEATPPVKRGRKA